VNVAILVAQRRAEDGDEDTAIEAGQRAHRGDRRRAHAGPRDDAVDELLPHRPKLPVLDAALGEIARPSIAARHRRLHLHRLHVPAVEAGVDGSQVVQRADEQTRAAQQHH
jgi:hypothetical protein